MVKKNLSGVVGRGGLLGVAVAVGAVTYYLYFIHKRKKSSNDFDAKILIRKLEERVQRDEGKRGIGNLIIAGELYAAASDLMNAKVVAILTGFPCLMDYNPPTETDGPPGAFAVARALIALGKKVYILTDEVNEEVLISAAAGSGLPGTKLFLESFGTDFDRGEQERLNEIAGEVDFIIAIERPGPGSDGLCYTMRARQLKNVAPIHNIFQAAQEIQGRPVKSIGIGDGGNEVGMGKVHSKVLESPIPNKEKIACVLGTDHLIVSSVSNWGGYALALALAILAAQERFFETREEALEKMVVSQEAEKALVHRMIQAGARDGITAELKPMVDGMSINVSLKVLRDLRQLALIDRLL